MLAYTDQLYSGTATASGDTYTSPVGTKYAKEGTFFLDITAVSGTSPTLDVTLRVYDRFSDDWYLLGTFTQKNSTGIDIGQIQYGLGEKVAIKYVISGSNPSFTFSVNATFKEG